MAEPENLEFIRIQLFLKKKDEVTDDFFHAYWIDNHVKLTIRHKKFFYTSPKLKAAAQEFKMPVPEYNGIAEIWVKEIEMWMSIVTDPDFVATIAPDEDHFIKAPIHIMLGYDNMVLGEATTPKETKI